MSTEEIPLLTGNTNSGYDETGEQIEMENLNTNTSSSSSSSRSTVINRHSAQEETSFGGDASETTSLLSRTESVDNAWDRIQRKVPNVYTTNSPFTEFGRIEVRLIRNKGKSYQLFKVNGEINDKLPKTVVNSLGKSAEEIFETNGEEIARHQERIAELRKQRATTSDENQRENLNQTIAEEMDAIAQLERANENIEERMTLRDRVKAIFKKYGFTVFAVASAVGVVIGVIVANLKNGLTSLGKGVGNGLKTIGKKLGEILPGLVGAIASFVFRTAGEVIGFLAKNAWLLQSNQVKHFAQESRFGFVVQNLNSFFVRTSQVQIE